MKKIFLHVGYHKTGTTSIQVSLYSNRQFLKAAGILYPEECCPDFSRFGQHILPWLFTSKEDYIPTLHGKRFLDTEDKPNYINSLKKEIERGGCETIILSSEEFDILNRSELELFRDSFSEYNIIPIVSIRNLPDLLISLYQTSVVHSSMTKSFSEFLDCQRARLDMDVYIDDLYNVFGNKVKVINFDNKETGHDIVKVFINLIEPELLKVVSIPKKQNLSVPLYALEILKFFRSKGISREFEKIFLERISDRSSNLKYTLFSEEIYIKYIKKYECIFNHLQSSDNVELIGFDKEWSEEKFSFKGIKVDNLVRCIMALTDDTNNYLGGK